MNLGPASVAVLLLAVVIVTDRFDRGHVVSSAVLRDEQPASEVARAEGLVSPVLGMGVSQVRDWSTQDPFIDVMKTSREWIGHVDGWGGMTYDELRAGGYLDENGWLMRMPERVQAVESLIMVDLPKDATSFNGRYRLTYEGTGTIEVRWATNVSYADGEIWFDRTPHSTQVGIQIQATDPAGTGDYIRNIEIVRERHIPMHEAGAIFNPEWIARIEDLRVIRFMQWMLTNDIEQSEWADRPKVDDVTYTRLGVPVEVMVRLSNEIGADPWFSMPHRATDEYMAEFAAYVRDALDPDLVAHVEFSNEVWNFGYAQSHWAMEGARARWGHEDNGAWMNYAGMRAAEMARIWDAAYGPEERHRLRTVLGVQTGWLGLEQALLLAPMWVAEDPQTIVPPYRYFDDYAVTGYFGPLGGEKADTVRGWIRESHAAAERAAEARALSGLARQRYLEAHRYDLAVDLAVRELRANEVRQLVEDWLPYHARVAHEHDLTLTMYEGGTHVVGIGPAMEDQELTDFFVHLNYTTEMAELYDTVLHAWKDVGGTLFNAYFDIGAASKYGAWGHLRHLTDDNPRWDALTRFNEGNTAWWETRATGAFDHGVQRTGTGGPDLIDGTSEEDVLVGMDGDDILRARGGGDFLNGGAGTDTVELAGRATDYRFERRADGLLLAATGRWTVHLRDIEILKFDETPEMVLETGTLGEARP